MAGKLVPGRRLTENDRLSGAEAKTKADYLVGRVKDQATRKALEYLLSWSLKGK